ncbi:zinc finger protein 185 [Salarias fasciatus]|uniref:zinc finger protein 185 n=1 Tax=Salarias fasciatus TaxID=181472 RepID=UPI0011764CAA|nr:zinc finger protein 185-like [Salarias fasciatus]
MSKEVDRHQVFRTTRVRTALKNDASWILKSNDEEEGQDKAGTDHTEKRSPYRQKSYVLSAARRFGSIDSSVSPPHQKTEVAPSEGDSTSHSNGEIIPAHKASEPEGSTVETATDIKPQETTEEPTLNGDAHPERNVEIRGENGEAAGDESSVEHSDGGAEAPADVPREDSIQMVSSVEGNTEAVPPAESPEQLLARATSEEHADSPADPSNAGHSEVDVTAVANVDDPSGEISNVDGTVEGNAVTEINAAPTSQEESLSKTDLGDVGGETSAQREGESCDESPAEQAIEEIVAASPEVIVEPSTEAIDVKSAPSEEQISVVTSVESVPDIVESVSESPSQPASEITAEDGCSQTEAEGTEEIAAAEVAVEPLPAVSETTQEEEAAPHNAVQTVPDILSEPSAPPDAETAAEDSSDTHHAEPVTERTVEAAAEVVLESSPATVAVINSTQEEEAAPCNAAAEPPAPPDAAADVESVECEVESVAPAEPVLKATTEVVEGEVQSVANTAVEQSIDPTPESPAAVELDIKDSLEPADASDAEALQENGVDQTIKLTDALDVEIPEPQAVPEPVEDQKPALSEESQPSQQSNGTNISEEVQKLAEELNSTTTQITYRYAKGICSFCDQKIDGNVKISLSDPLVECHPECLKCGVCALALGDLLKPMFLRGQVIQCGSCAAGPLKI